MSAEILREAAALMRERAEAATGGQWEHFQCHAQSREEDRVLGDHSVIAADKKIFALLPGQRSHREADAEHIASQPPVVVLAVADLLDELADHIEGWGDDSEPRRCDVGAPGDHSCAKAALHLALLYVGQG